MYLLKVPRLGQTMERGIILAWLVEEGAEFEVGDELYELETEKSTSAVEAKASGTLHRIVAETEVELPVGTVIAVVAEAGEQLDDAQVAAALLGRGPAGGNGSAAPAPAEVTAPPTSGPPTAAPVRTRAVPRARALATQLGVDLASVAGTGDGGVVTVADVELAAGAAPPSPAVRDRRPVAGIARAMADAMVVSWTAIPQFVQQVTLDATALLARRAELAAGGVAVSVTDLMTEAVAAAAVEVPEANATFTGDEIVFYADVNVGIAVATDNGLVVPVVHGAQSLGVDLLAQRTRGLTDRARRRALRPEDTAGATITLSNLGRSGVDTGTPLVTPPQTAVVFAGTLADRPVVHDGQVVVRPTVGLAIGFDHRVLDGATAARFTRSLLERLGTHHAGAGRG